MANVFRKKSGSSFTYTSGYVFYQDLEKTRPGLYGAVSKQFKAGLSGNRNAKYQQMRIISSLENFVRTERQKELNCLRNAFGVNINIDESMLFSPNFDKEIVETFNSLLQTKEMFRRHLSRINHLGKDGNISHQAKIGFANVFQEQLLGVINNKVSNWVKTIAAAIEGNPNTTLEQVVKSVVTESEIDKAIIEALEKARVSGDWSKSDQNNGLQGYLEILTEIISQINSMPNHPLMQEIKRAYGFDKLTSKITEEISKSMQQKNPGGKKSRRYWARKTLTYSGSTKGTIAEVFSAVTVNSMNGLSGGGGNLTWNITATHTGPLGTKTDVIIGVNVNSDDIVKSISGIDMDSVRRGESVRKKNVEEFNRISQNLDKLKDDQFIIYSNVKEYSLVQNSTNGYIFSGFSAGSAVNLHTLLTLGVPNEIINAIINTLQGAVAEGLQGRLNNVLAEYMATFLFDDFQVIGSAQSGAHSLHMMLLDGVYLPMSVCYNLLLNSFKEMAVETVFKADISEGTILYKNPPDGGWRPELWGEQQGAAMSTMTVTVKIMANFIQLMQQFN